MQKKSIIVFFFLMTFFSNLFSQTSVEASATVDKNKVKLGDSILYTVTVKRQGTGNFTPEVIPPSFDGFRVVGSYSQNSVSIINMAATITTNMQYELIPVKSGEIIIDSAYVKFRDPATGNIETIKTKPITIYVDSGKPKQNITQVIPTPTQEIEEDIREIKTKLQFRFSDLIPYIVVIILFIVALTLAALFIFKKPSEPVITQYDIDYRKEAIKKLKSAREHLKKNNIKSYYFDIYEAVRYFLSMHLKVSLNELTTREILKKLQELKVDKQMLDILNLFMSDCDIVKFADY
ncbi:MAG: BatD family protein, partial [Candidatus Goldbacteria bacterium]|nr:BatD family protein [Candidatus Goldiibacteriota bacterium]